MGGPGSGTVTKYTEEAGKAIIDGWAGGLHLQHAAAMGHVTPATVHRWLRKGRAGERPYASFYDRLTWARANRALELLARVEKGGKGMMGVMWLLERCFGYTTTKAAEVLEPLVMVDPVDVDAVDAFLDHVMRSSPLRLEQAHIRASEARKKAIDAEYS